MSDGRASANGSSQLAQLRMAVGAARDALSERIERGREIMQADIYERQTLQQMRDDYYTWNEYNRDLLARMFTDRSIADEYSYVGYVALGSSSRSSSIGEEIDRFRRDVGGKIRRLESVRERLDLYEVSDEPAEAADADTSPVASSGVFIIHGQDREAALELKQLLKQKADIDAVLMDEKPHIGRTLIEKFEQEAENCGFAIAVLTPDDVVTPDEGPDYHQMRPNVVFEMGWFYGRLGRDRTCILYKTPTEIPTDLEGIGYYTFEHNVRELWADIEEELQRAGVIEG